jgi:putative membrane protein
MAWTRTATSLISFGFTVYKFFEYERKEESAAPGGLRPRWFALLMIVIGLVALVLATIEHHRALATMKAEYGHQPVSLALIVAGLIAVLGIVGLVAVIFHL